MKGHILYLYSDLPIKSQRCVVCNSINTFVHIIRQMVILKFQQTSYSGVFGVSNFSPIKDNSFNNSIKTGLQLLPIRPVKYIYPHLIHIVIHDPPLI